MKYRLWYAYRYWNECIFTMFFINLKQHVNGFPHCTSWLCLLSLYPTVATLCLIFFCQLVQKNMLLENKFVYSLRTSKADILRKNIVHILLYTNNRPQIFKSQTQKKIKEVCSFFLWNFFTDILTKCSRIFIIISGAEYR